MLRLRVCTALVAVAAFGQEPKPVFTRPSEYTPPPDSTYPAAEWERVASPETAGYSSARLDVLRAWLKTQDTTGMMVVASGRVLFEYGNVVETSKVASVRKSLLGMLFGKLCLSEIPSDAGVGRRIVAANHVFERFVGSNGEAREVHAAICEQIGVPSCRR